MSVHIIGNVIVGLGFGSIMSPVIPQMKDEVAHIVPKEQRGDIDWSHTIRTISIMWTLFQQSGGTVGPMIGTGIYTMHNLDYQAASSFFFMLFLVFGSIFFLWSGGAKRFILKNIFRKKLDEDEKVEEISDKDLFQFTGLRRSFAMRPQRALRRIKTTLATSQRGNFSPIKKNSPINKRKRFAKAMSAMVKEAKQSDSEDELGDFELASSKYIVNEL